MGVRVQVRAESSLGPFWLESAAVANSGFESDEPVCSLPAAAAERLGWWPNLPPQAVIYPFLTYGGTVNVPAIPSGLRVRVLAPGRAPKEVLATAVISTTDNEIVLNDGLVAELSIVLVDTRRGTWCFRDEPMTPGRPSEPAQYW
ncbi:MAG: hypothetical protein HY720_19270 [Planctomycetes bacterium]|nr:hypothetical protein [Planctomycetota bacterium]